VLSAPDNSGVSTDLAVRERGFRRVPRGPSRPDVDGELDPGSDTRFIRSQKRNR